MAADGSVDTWLHSEEHADNMIWKIVFVAFLAVGVFADTNLPDDKRKELKEMLRQQCKKNGAEDKVNEVEEAGKSFIECAKGLFDAKVLQKEIEEAKPNGALDEVFKKYCAKTPQLKTCIHNLMVGVTPCLDQTAKDNINPFKEAADQLIDFVCFKDGDRIALFIAEGGPECLQSKADSIRQCGEKLKSSFPTLEAAQSLSLKEKCGKFDELSSCVVKALEECSTPTPANMAESLLRYVRKGSPCKDQ